MKRGKARTEEYRSIYCRLLDDPEFQALSPEAQRLFFYLRLSTECGPIGLFRFYPSLYAERMHLASIAGLLEELQREGWVSIEAGWILIHNAMRFEPSFHPQSDAKHRRCVLDYVAPIRNLGLVRRLFEESGMEWDQPNPEPEKDQERPKEDPGKGLARPKEDAGRCPVSTEPEPDTEPEPHETETVQEPPGQPVESVEKSTAFVGGEDQDQDSQDLQLGRASPKRTGMHPVGFSAAKLLQGLDELQQKALTQAWVVQHFSGITPAQAKRWVEFGGTLQRAQQADEGVREWKRQSDAAKKPPPGPGGMWECLVAQLTPDEARDLRDAVRSDQAAFRSRAAS